METFLMEIWRIFEVLKPIEFWWIICGIFPWTGLGGFGIWERRFISTRNKKFDFQSLWATRNQKLKIKLVQGWPRNGPQIRKSQNTEDLKKLFKVTKFRLNLDMKTREICWETKTIQNFLVWPNLDSWSSCDLPKRSSLPSADKKKSPVPLIRSCQQNHEQILRAGKTMTQKLEMSWTTWHYSSLKAKPTEGLTDYSLVEFPLAVLQFFRWIIKMRVIRDFHDFFVAINLELLLCGFQGFFLIIFLMGARPWCSLG